MSIFQTPYGLYGFFPNRPRLKIDMITEFQMSLRSSKSIPSADEKCVLNYLTKRSNDWISLHNLRKKLRWPKRRMGDVIRSLIAYKEIVSKIYESCSGLKWKKRHLYQINGAQQDSRHVPFPQLRTRPDLQGLWNARETQFRKFTIKTATSPGWFSKNFHSVLQQRISDSCYLVAMSSGILDPKTASKSMSMLKKYIKDTAHVNFRKSEAAVESWLDDAVESIHRWMIKENVIGNGWEGLCMSVALLEGVNVHFVSIGGGDAWINHKQVYHWNPPTEPFILPDRTLPLDMGWCAYGDFLGMPKHTHKKKYQHSKCTIVKNPEDLIVMTLGFRGQYNDYEQDERYRAFTPCVSQFLENGLEKKEKKDCIDMSLGKNREYAGSFTYVIIH